MGALVTWMTLHSVIPPSQMSKTIGTLEKEMLMWKSRYEKCNRSLLEMAEEVGGASLHHWHCHHFPLYTTTLKTVYLVCTMIVIISLVASQP